jgi:hypothetical protein
VARRRRPAYKTQTSDPAAPEYTIDVKEQRKRSDKAWSDRAAWDHLYQDVYDFAIPYRRPAARVGKGAVRIERVFDATAIESSFRAAGQLHSDLFPPGFGRLAPGAVSKAALPPAELEKLEAQLNGVSTIMSAFFETGEFATSTAEMCIDLMAGTAALLPLEGDAREPVRYACIPFDELAIECDAFGRPVGIYWKQSLTHRQIKDAFPNGVFSEAFKNRDNYPDEELELRQDFIRDPKSGKWTFCAYTADSEHPIDEQEYLTQPMAVPRYHRVPGEPYGRGPILLALPTIKTLNKAVELTLKAAAMQMVGIWGYRPGGTFNPDTVRFGPGEFWPMQATGGVLGPDVTRLDPSSGRVDVGQLITQELRLQVQSMLGDDRLPEKGATPVSATEIMARMKRIAQNYLGAWGRIVQEVHPVIVRRVLEILHRQKFKGIQQLDIDGLLIKLDVQSPITAAIKAAAHSRIIDFIELCMAVKGTPMAADLIVKVDDALRAIGKEQIPNELIRTKTEQKQLEKVMAQAAAAIAAAQQKPAGVSEGAAQSAVA